MMKAAKPWGIARIHEARGQENGCRQTVLLEDWKGDVIVVLKTVVKSNDGGRLIYFAANHLINGFR